MSRESEARGRQINNSDQIDIETYHENMRLVAWLERRNDLRAEYEELKKTGIGNLTHTQKSDLSARAVGLVDSAPRPTYRQQAKEFALEFSHFLFP